MKSLLKSFLFTLVLCGLAQADSYSTTQEFYDWYLESGSDYREKISQAKPHLSSELFGLLSRGFALTPDNGRFVDFDPFINAQISAKRISVGKPHDFDNDMQWVKVTPFMEMGQGGSTIPMPELKVFLAYDNGGYKITNIVYPADPEAGVKSWDLRSYLQDLVGQANLSEGEAYGDPHQGYQGEDPSTMLSPEERAAEIQGASLAAKLEGTWVHKATSKTADGTPRPLDIAVIKWTFKPGGKCDFYQKVGSGKPMTAEDRPYSIDGSTITLGSRTKYTVVSNSIDKMIWKNHRLGDFYHVERE